MKLVALVALLGVSPSLLGAEIVVREGVGIRTPRVLRSVVHTDPVELSIVQGTWKAPTAGEAGWAALKAGADGSFQGGPTTGGYVYCTVDSPSAKTMLLEASGHTMVYVNGSPRAGDPYSYGYVSLPVALKAGRNELLFSCSRGRLSVKLIDVAKPVSLDLRDATTPEVIKGEKQRMWAAVVVRNATDQDQKGLTLNGTKLPPIPALSCRKVGFQFQPTPKVSLKLVRDGQVADEATLDIRTREPGQPYKRTFVSGIDGSVQYYGVNPSLKQGPGQALFLSLHGASVEAIGQAEAYSPKTWGYIVAATNRRPYGFDWEDVGRLDALEVLGIAKKEFKTDPSQTYLTGHSMGGHGTWQIGVLFPDLFAAIAPSAGWISFTSYANGMTYQDVPIQRMLRRASASSDTLGLKYNYSSEGVYILHGDADDNVPVTEARTMRTELGAFHHDFDWHEEKGANHWWDTSPEPGSDAVDYAPIFEMFAHHRLPAMAERRFIDFSTVSSGISSTLGWATIEQQEHSFMLSRVQLEARPVSRRIVGTTSNVRKLTLNMRDLSALELDGQTLKPDTEVTEKVSVIKVDGKWAWAGAAVKGQKGPQRYGGFKDVYRNRVMFVYGTHGSAEENAWARDRARYDAESFWYRGNGSVDVVSDQDFDPNKDKDRNVVVYGNATMNSAWKELIGDEYVLAGSVSVGSRMFSGLDSGVLLIRPRPGSETASVAGIGGSGPIGMRLTDRIPLFSSGAGIPDYIVLSPALLEKGAAGIRAAGFFGNDWSVATGDFDLEPTN